MTEDNDDPERIGRPVQSTPEFFVDTLSEHETRGDIEGGICTLRMADDGRRRFVIGADLNEMDERDYVVGAVEDLIDLIETEGVLSGTFEARIPVDDADRVVEEAREENAVTVHFNDEALSGLLAKFLVELVAEE